MIKDYLIIIKMLTKFWKIFCLQQGEEVIYQKKINKYILNTRIHTVIHTLIWVLIHIII